MVIASAYDRVSVGVVVAVVAVVVAVGSMMCH